MRKMVLTVDTNVMMIFVLIIIITQQIFQKTDISYSNQSKPRASIKLERKRKSDCNNQFHPSSPTLLLFSHSLPLSHSFPPTDSGKLRKYVNMHGSTYTKLRTYVHTCDSTCINILTFNNIQMHTNNPNFSNKK